MTCEEDRSSPPPLPCPQRVDSWSIDPFDAQFRPNIYSLNIDSRECLSEVQSLLNSPSNVALASSFQGREAQSLIHQVSHSCRPPWAYLSCGEKRRPLCAYALTTTSGGSPCGLFAGYPKHRGSYPRRISFKRRTYTLERFATRGHLES